MPAAAPRPPPYAVRRGSHQPREPWKVLVLGAFAACLGVGAPNFLRLRTPTSAPRLRTIARAEAQGDSQLPTELDIEQPPQKEDTDLVDAWKRELLGLAAAGNRGFGLTSGSKARLLELVELLEGSFSPPDDAASRQTALEGSWAVIFTSSPDLTSLDRLPLPGWRTARIGQAFEANGDARNEIQFVSPLGSRINQTVQCGWRLTQNATTADLKVDLTFQGSSTKLARIAGLEPPLQLPPLEVPLLPATGVFKVSFADNELLVQRTSAGARGVNVLIRES